MSPSDPSPADLEQLRAENTSLKRQVENLDAELAQLRHSALAVSSNLANSLHPLPPEFEPVAFLKTLLDSLPDSIYVKDAQSRVLYTNRAGATIVGTKNMADSIGKTDYDFFPSDQAARFRADDLHVVNTGEPIIGQEEPVQYADGKRAWFLTTKLPLRDAAGKIIGLIGIGKDITEVKNTRDALARSNEELTAWITELEHRNQEIAILNKMTHKFQSCITVEDLFSHVGRYVEKIFLFKPGALYIQAEDQNTLWCVARWGDTPDHPPSMLTAACPAFLECKTRRVVSRNDLPENCRYQTLTDQIFSPYLCVPVYYQGVTLGVLHQEIPEPSADSPYIQRRYAIETIEQTAHAIAERISLALTNLRLSEKLRIHSTRDPLTNCFNRRYMEETLHREIHRASRQGSKFWIMMIDLDHLKAVNDTYGHDVGDKLLRKIGDFFQANIRGEDIACRYGGDEFIIILLAASLSVAYSRAEKLREGIKRISTAVMQGTTTRLTMSVGLASYPDHGQTVAEILKAADTATYQAKNLGRDQVVIARSSSLIT